MGVNVIICSCDHHKVPAQTKFQLLIQRFLLNNAAISNKLKVSLREALGITGPIRIQSLGVISRTVMKFQTKHQVPNRNKKASRHDIPSPILYSFRKENLPNILMYRKFILEIHPVFHCTHDSRASVLRGRPLLPWPWSDVGALGWGYVSSLEGILLRRACSVDENWRITKIITITWIHPVLQKHFLPYMC